MKERDLSNRMLSIIIPARNEEYLKNTIDDILSNIEADTEIIAVLDGEWANPPIKQNERVTIIYFPQSIGQRAATNMACRLSKTKYVMKVDAHCSFDKGFDRKMIEAFKEIGDNATIVPIMKNLHIFNWKCSKCGEIRYQGQSGVCKKCGDETKKEIVWIAKQSPNSTSYRFDTILHFQYWGEYKKKQKGDLVETLSLQGSCFMMTREKYQELNICDESWGSWGNQGTEVAIKTWLSGGKVIVNKKTWYSHCFRTQGGDFGFPYPQSGKQVEYARQCSRDLFFDNKYDKQIYPLSWLIEKFRPIPNWHENSGKEMLDYINKQGEDFYNKRKTNITGSNNGNDVKKGIIFYTSNDLNLKIAHKVQNRLKEIGLPIVSASLKPMSHFGKNIYIKEKRGVKAYFKQILSALEQSTANVIFFCEHDVLYNSTHFDFTPQNNDIFYFNINVIKMDWETKKGIKVDDCQQISGMCCYRELALKFYREKMKQIEEEKFNKHYEPQGKRESWSSEKPIIDIRHSNNLTKTRWVKEEFRNKNHTKGWTEIEKVIY